MDSTFLVGMIIVREPVRRISREVYPESSDLVPENECEL